MCDADKSANNKPYVIKLIEVIRNSMAPYIKPFTVTGRHSDAYVYILTGTCFYEFENDSFSVKAGDILYLANDSTYRMSVGGGGVQLPVLRLQIRGRRKRRAAQLRLHAAQHGGRGESFQADVQDIQLGLRRKVQLLHGVHL